jgi:putative ABC transport system permease protein
LRLPFVFGRDFSGADTAAALPVVIVNETLARRLWPGINPIGQRLRVADSAQSWREVVGVVGDAKYLSLTEAPRSAYYGPVGQQPDSALSLVVRSAEMPSAVLETIAGIARNLDPDLPLFDAQTLDDSLRQSVRLRRATTSLFGVLGGLTLLLAAIGVYGVAAHSASVRTREVGIRMALGARAIDVSRLLVRENLFLSLVGVVIGLGLSLATSRLLTSFLFGLTPTDPRTLLGASTILCAVGLLASYLPARRAARVDPLVALRYE